jgi:hypothetical protein
MTTVRSLDAVAIVVPVGENLASLMSAAWALICLQCWSAIVILKKIIYCGSKRDKSACRTPYTH